MKLLRRSVVVALTWMLGCSAPAVDGVDGAGPAPDKDGALAGDADEGNGPGAVDAPETTVPTPSTTSPLVAFKGGASIALRWSVVGQGLDGAARWNVLRDGTKIATVEPGYHPEFPEKDGKGFIDKDIRPGATYEYRIQVVDAAGGTTDLGSPLKVTTPSTFSPPPTIQLDTSKRPELASYFAQAKAFLEIWYPKVAFALAEPDYKPFSSFAIRYDPNEPTFVFADGVGKALNLSPAAVNNRQDNGMFLHEATHLLHNAKGIPGWVVEGVADWTRDFMLHDRDPKKPGPTNDFKDGYSTSAYFFDWLEKSYGKPFVRNIVVTSNKAAMTSFFFFEQTGKQLPTLWEEMTGRHTPVGLLKFTAMAPKCVDGGGPVAEAGHAKVATCNAAAATQAWSWGYHNPSANDGLIWLEAMGGGCLDVKDKSKEMGALVRAWPCGKHEGQMWKLLPNGSLLNPNSGYCLDNPNSSTVDGTSLRTWDCNGSPAQRFTLPQ